MIISMSCAVLAAYPDGSEPSTPPLDGPLANESDLDDALFGNKGGENE
ncbi:hypothetical protein ACQEU8_11535 [Streptomyces sp. CA-250714]